MSVSLSVRMFVCLFHYNATVFNISGCRRGHLGVVRYLVTEAQCDPNVGDNDGWTPLHHASM